MSLRAHLLAMLGLAVLWSANLGWAGWSPGLFNIDELHYVLAAQRFAENQNFEVANGFASFRDSLLLFMHPLRLRALPEQDVMTTFIPPLWTFPAAVAWSVAGAAGIKVFNLLCYVVALMGIGWLGGRLASDHDGSSPADASWSPRAGWIALAFAAGGTYFAEYAVSANSHMLTLALVLGALAAHPLMLSRNPSAAAPALLLGGAFLCGLLIGCAVGVRLQSIVPAAALGAGMLLLPRRAVSAALAYLGGLAGPMALTSAINAHRFGIANPFTYGIPVQRRLQMFLDPIERHPALAFLVIALAIAGALAAYRWAAGCWMTVEPTRRQRLTLGALWAALGLLLALAFLTPLRGNFAERVTGLLLFGNPNDYWRGLDPIAMVWTGFRSALLPTAPVLVLGLLAPLLLPAEAAADPRRLLLIGLAWSSALFVCLLKNNGGFFMNQRYLIEAAVFALLLSVDLIARWSPRLPRGSLLAGAGLAVALVGGVISLGTPGLVVALPLEQGVSFWALPDFWFSRVVPILLALGLLVSGLALRWSRGAPPAPARWVFGLCLVPCALLPFVLHAWYHWVFTHEYRETNWAGTQAMAPHIPDGSLILVSGREREIAGYLKLDRDVWIADTQRAPAADTQRVFRDILASGQRPHIYATLTALGAFEGQPYEWRLVVDGPVRVAELVGAGVED
ncbi:MAG: hypothetical protein RLY93_16760 [Sumerlaeia bacterium]